MNARLLSLLLLLFANELVSAQETWNLVECIDQVVINNIGVRTAESREIWGQGRGHVPGEPVHSYFPITPCGYVAFRSLNKLASWYYEYRKNIKNKPSASVAAERYGIYQFLVGGSGMNLHIHIGGKSALGLHGKVQ